MWDATSHTSSLCPLVFRAGCQMSICLFYWLVNSIQCKQLFVADLRGLLNYPQSRRHTRHLNCQPGLKGGRLEMSKEPIWQDSSSSCGFYTVDDCGSVLRVSTADLWSLDNWTCHLLVESPPSGSYNPLFTWFTIQCAVNHCHMVITYYVESAPFRFIDVRD